MQLLCLGIVKNRSTTIMLNMKLILETGYGPQMQDFKGDGY
jgi:hypothetical protein